MNSEEDEFRRIEREALRRAAQDDDDDTQVYVKPWVGLTEEEKKHLATAAGCTEDDDGHIVTEIFRLAEAKLKEKNSD